MPCDNFAKLAFVHPALPRDPSLRTFSIVIPARDEESVVASTVQHPVLPPEASS